MEHFPDGERAELYEVYRQRGYVGGLAAGVAYAVGALLKGIGG